MILDHVTFNNFGVFGGEQRMELTPPSNNKPVVLVGGLNGGGKTTILEGILLALYGKLAGVTRQRPRSYETYLRQAIHRNIKPSDGASVEVGFRSHEGGMERSYRVRRRWSSHNGSIDEYLDVFVGKGNTELRDDLLSEAWSEQVERFIPGRLAHLFFFDGEQIESLADPDKSADMLTTGIHALLGIDLVQQLQDDLKVLARRKRKEQIASVDRHKVDHLENELNATVQKITELNQMAASVRARLDQSEKWQRDVEQQFRRAGGTLLDHRRTLEQRQAELKAELRTLRQQLVQEAYGGLPLTMVVPLLQDIEDQAQVEHEVAQQRTIADVLAARDEKLLAFLKERDASGGGLRLVHRFLAEQQPPASVDDVGIYLGLSRESTTRVGQLLERQLSADYERNQELLASHDRLVVDIDDVERRLAAVPDEDSIGEQLKERSKTQLRVDRQRNELDRLDDELQQQVRQRDRLARQLEDLLRSEKLCKLDTEDSARILRHAEKVRETVAGFRQRVIEKHTQRLEQLVHECYRRLLRKRSLVNRIQIDAKTCTIRLVTGNGRVLPAERLSAGERQLLAVSMLWGLGRAADRPIPVVIDTPLGRLDASHRSHLVERYFPRASHQVLLLSTDEEIDPQHLEKIKPAVGRSYRLQFDDAREATEIEEGYFW